MEKCRKCGVEHHPKDDHCFNLQYQYWLNRELEKVDRAVKSKYEN